MNQMEHPSTESLQGYAEGAIAEGERTVLEVHLAACPECSVELAEWRSLFANLSELPQLAPTAGFTNRVMARIKLPAAAPVWAQWLAAARQFTSRLAPRTAGAWAFASAFVVLPLLLGGGVMAWLVSKDYITAQSLWMFFTDRTASSMQSLGASTLNAVVQSSVAAWLVQQGRTLADSAGLRGLGALAAGIGGMTVLSIWILYRNLFRTPTREANHVPFNV